MKRYEVQMKIPSGLDWVSMAWVVVAISNHKPNVDRMLKFQRDTEPTKTFRLVEVLE